MQAEVPRTKGVGRPPRLSLDTIIEAANRILQAEGAAKLSMRRLATELGSAPMAVYYHVRDKDGLLLLVMEAQAGEIARPDFSADPRERLAEASIMLYELLAERPWIVEVLTGDDLLAPSALWMVEEILDAAVAFGFSREHAVYVYRTIWYYIVGDLIIRVTSERRRSRIGKPIFNDEVMADLTAGKHPHLAAVSDRWAELTECDLHRAGLRAIVEGLLPQAAAEESPRHD